MLKTADISEIKHGSDAYHHAVELREKVLRQPLGLSFSTDELLAESDSIHLACSIDTHIVGACVLKPISRNVMRMRQLVVHTQWQRQGLGSLLVAEAEAIVKLRGPTQMDIYARESVISFYKRLGYCERGEFFTVVGLPHKAMTKTLI